MGWLLMGFLVICATVSLTDAECHCSTTELCNKFPSTPCSQMDGQDMCQEGWFGPYCHKQNIALGRSSSQSSTLEDLQELFGARLGVDGRATTNITSLPRTCTHTANQSNPTWTVNLNTSVPEKIQHIRLYIRDRQECSNWGIPVTAVLGVLLICTVTGGTIYIRRLLKQLESLKTKMREEHYVTLDERTKTTATESTYEHIDNATPYYNTVNVQDETG